MTGFCVAVSPTFPPFSLKSSTLLRGQLAPGVWKHIAIHVCGSLVATAWRHYHAAWPGLMGVCVMTQPKRDWKAHSIEACSCAFIVHENRCFKGRAIHD